MAEKSVSTRGLWRFLNNLKDLFVQDAPSDGKQYARKNKTWAEVQGGGGPVDAYTKTESDSRFAHKTGNEDISGLKNFLNGIKSGTVNIPTAGDGVTIAASDVDGDNGKVSLIGDAGSFTLEVERDPLTDMEVATKGYADTKFGQLEERTAQVESGKQDKLIAGQGITIAEDGKTISAQGGGGGADTFIVNFTRNGGTRTCDKTFSEIAEAYNAGKVVLMELTDVGANFKAECHICRLTSTSIRFSTGDYSSGQIFISVNSNGTTEYTGAVYAPSSYIGSLRNLTTTATDNLVNAINELVGRINALENK